MLITAKVMVKWNGGTKKHYIGKGYIFTKMNDEFEVKVEDLTKGSHALVNVKCDCPDCENSNLKPMDWRTYLSCIHDDGKYYCNKCNMKLTRGKIKIFNANRDAIDFQQWCYDNLSKKEAENILLRWNYKLNKCSPNEVPYNSKGKNQKGYWFKCLKHPEHHSELKSMASFTVGHKGSLDCNQCNSFAQWGIDNLEEDFLEKYWDYEKNIISPWDISYGNCSNKIWIFCQDNIKKSYHNSYDTFPNGFTVGKLCPYCSGKKVHKFDSLGWIYPQIFKIWSDRNTKSPYEFLPWSVTKVWWKCPECKHEDYFRKICSSMTSEFRCSSCTQERDESFLQEKVRLYIESLNYEILHEHKCTIVPINPRTKCPLPFDNEVVDLNLIIEVHGVQHYNVVTWHKNLAKRNNTMPEYELHYQKLKDRYKKYISHIQKYNYIEIPYWTDDNDETWKSLIDNKIKEII